MPSYTLKIVEADLTEASTIASEQDPDELLAEGVRGALGIAADDLSVGRERAVLMVVVEDDAGRAVRRSMVAISVLAIAPDLVRWDAL